MLRYSFGLILHPTLLLLISVFYFSFVSAYLTIYLPLGHIMISKSCSHYGHLASIIFPERRTKDREWSLEIMYNALKVYSCGVVHIKKNVPLHRLSFPELIFFFILIIRSYQQCQLIRGKLILQNIFRSSVKYGNWN